MSSANEATKKEDQIKPLCHEIKKDSRCGNAMIKCHLCEISFTGSYTRVRTHLLIISREGVRPCSKVTPSKLTKFKKKRTMKQL